jgi:hypothetical protein
MVGEQLGGLQVRNQGRVDVEEQKRHDRSRKGGSFVFGGADQLAPRPMLFWSHSPPFSPCSRPSFSNMQA